MMIFLVLGLHSMQHDMTSIECRHLLKLGLPGLLCVLHNLGLRASSTMRSSKSTTGSKRCACQARR